jgi:hypothetical protein
VRATGWTDFDTVERYRGHRQNPDLDRPTDPHIEAGQAAGFGLEKRAVIVPVNKIGADERRQQRQNDGNPQS